MPPRPAPRVALVTPALADANNGNWQTARRYALALRPRYQVRLAEGWDGAPADLLLGLHARRSAAAIAAFAARCPRQPIVLVLTGTDVYRDIATDAAARQSLQLATRLVVLQPAALECLDDSERAKAVVIFQSAAALRDGRPARRRFEVCLIGHLRPEKDPFTAAAALAHLPQNSRLRLHMVGAALSEPMRRAALRWAAEQPRLNWIPGLPHAATRQLIRRSRLLVIPSLMEGGSNAVIEAITAGVPVLASRISGNVGLLGEDYAGFFPTGDAVGLGRLMARAEAEPGFLQQLREQCERRRPLFDPQRERAAVRALIDSLLPDPAASAPARSGH